MKKLLSFLLTVVVLVSVIFCLPFNAYAAKSQIGDSNTYYSYDSSTKTITISGKGDMPNFITSDRNIPWYDLLPEIDKIVIDDGVTNIGAFAFYYANATSVSIPSSVKTINNYALSNMYLITKIDIPYGVTSIGQFALSGNKRLVDLTLPDSLEYIGARAFKSCTNLTDVTLPYSVTNIAMYAFHMCDNLENVVFQSMSSNVAISSYAFLACPKLKNISVPKNASCDKSSFGYQTTKAKYDDITMNVYAKSKAYDYASVNDFSINLLDTVDIECGVPYFDAYDDYTVNDRNHYRFVADSDMEYCFYTTGSIDVKAELYCDNKLVAENDDISNDNSNICIKYTCKKGESYDLYVSSVNYKGDYYLMTLPTDISSISISGEYRISALDGKQTDDGLVFSFDDSILMNDMFIVEYANGLVHRFVLNNSYYDGTYITVDTGVMLDCGYNNLPVHIGEAVSTKAVYVEHSYTDSIVQPTPDEDGHTLSKCINCDSSFKSDFFKTDKTIYTLTGKSILAEDRYGNHTIDLPYTCPTIKVGNREYSVNDDGSWLIRTFSSCYIEFVNPYGDNMTIYYKVDSENIDQEYGDIVLDGYDFNADGYINARDYIIYKKELKDSLCDGYWQFANNYVTTH